MKLRLLQGALMVALTLYVAPARAQEKCATDHIHQHMMDSDPHYRQYFENKDLALRADGDVARSTSTLTVPVMVWVFHNDGPENISREQVLDAIDVLNEDVQRLNSDTSNTSNTFKPVAGVGNIEFKLATVGPTGECTDGIVRVRTALTANAPNEIKNLVPADNNKYMNIYVVKTIENTFGGNGTILGYAYFPNPGQSALNDGIVIRHDVMGRIGSATTGFGPNNGGRTLTHELGHYLGLPHTFQSGCSGNNDGFSDTPPVAASNSGCSWGNSCSNDSPDLPDQGENYMDYTNGICQNMFSAQQVSRMESELNGTRSQLISSQNLLETGVDDASALCAPNAYIGASSPYVCLSDSLELFDYSWNGPVTARQWTLVNTNLDFSQDSVASLGFSAPGTYTIELNASNGQGNSLATRIINVFDTVGIVPGYYGESFEPPFPFGTHYQVQPNEMAYSWNVDTDVARTGTQSISVKNYFKTAGAREALLMPPLDMTQQTASTLEFSFAFARKTVDDEDELRIWVSTNCGVTWIPRMVIPAAQLATAPNEFFDEFEPSPTQWETATVNLAAYQSREHLLVKFEFTSGGGNNIYLDDLKIYETIGLEENSMKEIALYPNPMRDQLTIDLGTLEEVEIQIRDLTGRLLFSGRHSGQLELTTSAWTAGTYFAIFRTTQGVVSRKLIKR